MSQLNQTDSQTDQVTWVGREMQRETSQYMEKPKVWSWNESIIYWKEIISYILTEVLVIFKKYYIAK